MQNAVKISPVTISWLIPEWSLSYHRDLSGLRGVCDKWRHDRPPYCRNGTLHEFRPDSCLGSVQPGPPNVRFFPIRIRSKSGPARLESGRHPVREVSATRGGTIFRSRETDLWSFSFCDFCLFLAEVGPTTHVNGPGSTNGAERTSNWPRRPIIMPFRG